MADSSDVKLEISVDSIEEIITKLKDQLENHVTDILNNKVLEQEHIDVLKLLVEKNSSLLKNLANLLDAITKDNVINVNDIPFLIQFITDLYSFLHLMKKDLKKKSKELQAMIGPLLKYLLRFFLKEKTNLSQENMNLINSIIDNTINVLQLTTSLKIKKCNLF